MSLAASRPIRFVHRGQIVTVAGLPATTTVLQWLREQARCSGTKEGCNEGDCGACTVLVGELGEAPGDTGAPLALRPINACIQLLPTLDGKALLTVEDLAGACGDAGSAGDAGDSGHRGPVAALHPAQQALVDFHASQCGFCTPGFAVSLAACYERHAEAGTRATRQQLADDLSGNLCRCTGYRSILDAGQRMFDLPARRLDTAPIVVALRQLAGDAPLHYVGAPASSHHAGSPAFHAPRTLAALAALRAERPAAQLLAGGTDVALWVNKQFRDLGEIISVGEVAELELVTEDAGWLEIGAGVSLERAWAALARHWPGVREMWQRFASLPIRHAGTMGGNVANGSPIGDSAPVLIALGAEIVLRRADATRQLLLQDFYVDYMKNRLAPGEFVQALRVPLPQPGELLRAYKLSKRYDCDISALAAGLWLRLDGERVADVRLAFGGMAATVRRAPAAEAALRGRPWSQATVQAAMTALDGDYQPLTDLRASAGYRQRAARNLLQRWWLETRTGAGGGQALSAAQVHLRSPA